MPERLRDRKKAKTRAAIYDAALELLAASSYDEVSVDAICERAEVGRATFFRAYGSKFGLLHEFNLRLTDAARQATTDAGSATERLELVQAAIADAWTDAGPGALELARAFARSETVRTGQDIHPELIDLVADILGAGQADGEIRADLPAGLLAWLWVTAVAGVVATWLDGRLDSDLPTASTAIADLLSAGLQRPTPEPKPKRRRQR